MKNKILKCFLLTLSISTTSCALWDPSHYIDDPDVPGSDTIVINFTEDVFLEGKNSGTTLSFFNPITGNDSGYLQSLISTWNKAFGKSYFIKSTSNTEAIHYQVIDTNINNGTAPDIAIVHNTRVPYYQTKDRLRDLTTWASETKINKDDYINDLLSTGMFDDKLYSIIYDLIPTFLFFNKKMIPEGYTEEDILSDNFTVDTLIKMSKAAYVHNTKASKTIYGTAFNYAFTQQPFLNFLYQQGGQVVNSANQKKAAYNSTYGYNAASSLSKIPNSYTSEGYRITQLSGDDHIDVYSTGRALFTIDGIWQQENLILHNEKVDTGITFLPKIDVLSEKRNSYADGHCLVSFKNKRQTDIKDIGIKMFFKYLVDNNAFWCQGGKMAVRKDTLETKVYQDLEWSFISKDISLISMPEKKATFSYLIKTLPDYVSKLCEGSLTDVKSAVDTAAKEGEQLVEDW